MRSGPDGSRIKVVSQPHTQCIPHILEDAIEEIGSSQQLVMIISALRPCTDIASDQARPAGSICGWLRTSAVGTTGGALIDIMGFRSSSVEKQK